MRSSVIPGNQIQCEDYRFSRFRDSCGCLPCQRELVGLAFVDRSHAVARNGGDQRGRPGVHRHARGVAGARGRRVAGSGPHGRRYRAARRPCVRRYWKLALYRGGSDGHRNRSGRSLVEVVSDARWAGAERQVHGQLRRRRFRERQRPLGVGEVRHRLRKPGGDRHGRRRRRRRSVLRVYRHLQARRVRGPGPGS